MGDCGQSRCAIASFLVVLATGLSGCAFTYTDANGDRHAVGLLDVTVRAPAAPETLAGDVVEMTSLGLSIGQTAQGGYLTAGFNRETTAALRDLPVAVDSSGVETRRVCLVAQEYLKRAADCICRVFLQEVGASHSDLSLIRPAFTEFQRATLQKGSGAAHSCPMKSSGR